MANVKIPYALIPAVALPERYANMKAAIARGLPRLERQPAKPHDVLHIAAYGPSLVDTWPQLAAAYARGHAIVSMSGATKFLVERGVLPTFHLDMDPRKNKVMTSLPPVPGVTYLTASVCCPEYFDALLEAGVSVVLWHTVSSNWEQDLQWVSQEDPNALLVSTGSTIGLGAIQIGGVLGYTRFEIHGMDGSFRDGARHAGPHSGKTQADDITWDAGRVTYRTSRIMANAVAETINTAKNFPIITVWHGTGLTQALIRESNLANACCADETEKRNRLASLRPRVLDVPLQQAGKSYWDSLLASLEPKDLPELISHIGICEPRRVLAQYNTGTVPFESAVYLRAMSRFYKPQVIAEIGTFIGTSTLALHTGRVIYTCDRSNDCVPMTDSVITHPGRSSTEMLSEIQEKVDLFFVDGRLAPADLAHLERLRHDGTVFVFDDYREGQKGQANVALLQPHFRGHALAVPGPGPSSLAVLAPLVLAPRARLEEEACAV
jgi:hypothetical protein